MFGCFQLVYGCFETRCTGVLLFWCTGASIMQSKKCQLNKNISINLSYYISRFSIDSRFKDLNNTFPAVNYRKRNLRVIVPTLQAVKCKEATEVKLVLRQKASSNTVKTCQIMYRKKQTLKFDYFNALYRIETYLSICQEQLSTTTLIVTTFHYDTQICQSHNIPNAKNTSNPYQ